MKLELMNIFTDLLQEGPSLTNILNLIQTYKDHVSNKNLEECLLIMKTKINHSVLNGKLPELGQEDNNLMLSMFEEMQEIYTEVKRDCIINLVVNMLHEKNNGTFQLYTYQVIFDQLKQMYDPEILLFKEIHSKVDTLTCFINEKKNKKHLSSTELLKLNEYDSYRLRKIENLAFLENVTGFIAVDINGEYIYNKTYFDTFYNKVCTLLY
ncbi:hypothetical protein [Lysinibacillus capsici]|uniref:hypothetical protein n=1 Tax=Lysinibacillus capsici TaxID=2115968 RepID=UPI002897C9E2|nr:hypothetical protein [Lysinibacillus capsici]